MAKDRPSMPPPDMAKGKKPTLAIAIGVGKPKNGSSAPGNDDMEPDADDAPGGKVSAEDALVVRGDKHCSQCMNYHGEDGTCEKVDGNFAPDDACLRYFDAGGDESEPDADDMGGSALGGDQSMPQ